MARAADRGCFALLLAGVMSCSLAQPAHATAPGFFGVWLITEAHVAPWVKTRAAASTEETRRLIGSKVIYRKLRIEGPTPLGCAKPNYHLHEVPPDFLFQGSLTHPTTQAEALGFRLRMIETLETGCAGAIDFHFVDASTALFGLNNMIYTLRKQ